VRTVAEVKKVTIIAVLIIQIMATQLFLAGCGFKPRGSGYDSIDGQQVILVSEDPYGSLERNIKAALSSSGVDYDGTSNELDASNKNVIRILQQQLTRQVVSVDNNGRPAEYENTLLLEAEFIFDDGSEQKVQLSVRRNFIFDSSNSIAYDREEATILSEMRNELSHRLVSLYLRHLSGKVNP